MTDCIGQLRLARWEAKPDDERSAETSAHIQTCERCTAALAELISARQELLGSDPQAQSLAVARTIFAKLDDRRRKSWWRLPLFTLTPVAAAATVLLIISHGPAPSGQDRTGSMTRVAGAVRPKGPVIVEAFCKRGDRVFPVKDGDDFVAGDRLRFAYTKDQPGILVVFGVDDTGRIFPYYRDDALVGVNAPPGGEVMLPESVELDDYHGWERVFALWSAAPLSEEAIRAAVGEAMTQFRGDIRQAARLPVEAEQVSFLLRRP
jgi:hypothetical protein